MGDSRRFDLFAKMIAKQFPDRNLRIADVAGGKGYLSCCLKRDLGYQHVEFFDPKKRKKRVKKIKYSKRFFTEDMAKEFGLLIGLHPDEATDQIICAAGKNEIPFVVCPCCVMPSAEPFWGKHNYWVWLDHLQQMAERKGFEVQRLQMKMNGKNIVLVGRRNGKRSN